MLNEPNQSNLFIKISVNKKRDYTLAAFNGEMDKPGLEAVRTQLNETVEKLGTKYLVFDFTDLDFINSESIGFLLTIHYRLLKKEKILVLINVSPHVADVLEVIGIMRLIQHHDSLKTFEGTL